MKVYHGTSPAFAEQIVDNGIQPRGETGNSNWDATDMQSIRDHVYLSVPFAPFYGIAASDSSEIALVEVDVDALRTRDLYPDEDFVEQAIRSDELDIQYPDGSVDVTADISERTAQVRECIELFQPYWEWSRDILGNVSHKGVVPPEAITRVVVADPPSEIRLSIDPTIEIHAVGSIRSKYETLTALLMGDDVTRTEYLVAMMGIPVPDGASASEMVSDDDVEKMAGTRNIELESVLEQEYVTEIK